jgi:hypothetical protein
MPSNRQPSIVAPGPGKLAAGQVPASSLSFPPGGNDVSLHVSDPVDAHMASAIGIPETNPTTGAPLLSIVGGPYDGESVLDALSALADLLPVRPDRVGFDNVSVSNSGIPSWSNAMNDSVTAIHGGFTRSGVGIVTKYLTPTGSAGSQTINGTVYPADRGVLALYKTTQADFFNSGQTTLVSALWLGANPPPAGVPGANFVEGTRTSGQTDYSPANSGIDWFTLIDRLPYLSSYTGGEYTAFGSTFTGYQLGKYSTAVTLAAGDNGSYLLVHWKETYASTLTAIQPPALTAPNLVAANCYSAVPSDPSNYLNVNRLNVFVDAQSGSDPSGVTITTAPAGTLTTMNLSGVAYYSSIGLQANITSTINNLFQNSHLTNSSVSVSVPSGFTSTNTPAQVDMTDFGGTTTPYQLYDAVTPRIVNNVGGAAFTLIAPPATGDVARFEHSTHITVAGAVAPVYPYSQPKVVWRGAFASPVTATATERYLANTGGGSPTTTTEDYFLNETYRHVNTFAASSATTPIIPAGGNAFDSSVTIPSGELQVYAGRLVYPSVDFTNSAYRPVNASRNYATVLSGDAASNKRRYIRAFDTGLARNTGKLVITGLAFSAFDAGNAAIDSNEVTDHPGGAVVQIKVPGLTGWLDLGRANGIPDLTKTLDFRGCRTGISGTTYTYDTGSFTSDNGSGQFLIYVRVTFIKDGVGQTLFVDDLQWQSP